MRKLQIQVVVAVATTNDPFVAVRIGALFAPAVAFAIPTPTVYCAAAMLFALCTTTMTNAKSFAFLLVCASLVLTQLTTSVSFAEFAILRCAVTIYYAAHDLTTVTTAALVYLANLVAAFHDTLTSPTVRDAMTTTEVVLCTSCRFATLAWAFVFQTNASTECPILAVISLALFATAVRLAEAATAVNFCAVF